MACTTPTSLRTRWRTHLVVAFYGRESFLSSFHPSRIIDAGITFQTVEHLFQYKKASYFNDAQTATAILKAKTPLQAKTLGHKIKDYDNQNLNFVPGHPSTKCYIYPRILYNRIRQISLFIPMEWQTCQNKKRNCISHIERKCFKDDRYCQVSHFTKMYVDLFR